MAMSLGCEGRVVVVLEDDEALESRGRDSAADEGGDTASSEPGTLGASICGTLFEDEEDEDRNDGRLGEGSGERWASLSLELLPRKIRVAR